MLSLQTLTQLLSRMLALLDLQLTLAIKLFAVGVDCIEVFRGLYLVVLMSGHFVEVRQRIV